MELARLDRALGPDPQVAVARRVRVRRHRHRRRRRGGRRSRARIAVFQASRCSCQIPSESRIATPTRPKSSGAIIRRIIRRGHARPIARVHSDVRFITEIAALNPIAIKVKARAPTAGSRSPRTAPSALRRLAAPRRAAPRRRRAARRLRASRPAGRSAKVRDAARAVERPLLGQIESPRARAQDLADPVGRELDRRRVGNSPIRSRRQPARSGTRTSSPRCSSGSIARYQPPGPPTPSRTDRRAARRA